MSITRFILSLIFVLTLNSSAWAIWNCELNVDVPSSDDPCIVTGTLNNKQIYQNKDKNGEIDETYYDTCKNLNLIVNKINDDSDKCNVGGWSVILFKTNGVA